MVGLFIIAGGLFPRPEWAQDWQGSGHGIGSGLFDAVASTLGVYGAIALGLLFGFLLLRAFVLRKRYKAVGVLSAADLTALHSELAAAEKRTVGEIVPVVLERSDAHPAANWLAGLATAILGSALLSAYLPWGDPAPVLVCQVGMGAAGYLCARWLPAFRRAFITARRAEEMAREQALQEFFSNGLHRTEGQTGVLIFVSLLEHRVIVLADEGINRVVAENAWVTVDEAILAGIKAGSLCDGLLQGIRQAGDLLAEHAPWEEGDRNEIPDRIIVRSE